MLRHKNRLYVCLNKKNKHIIWLVLKKNNKIKSIINLIKTKC